MAVAVLWDLDGVLVDTAPYHYQAYRDLMAELGRDLPLEAFQPLFGLRNESILKELLGDLPPGRIAEMAQRKEELFRRQVAGKVKALPGAAELVRLLQELSIPQAVVSSTPRQNIDLILGSLGLVDAFPVIVAAEDVIHGKPDPEGFLLAASRLGMEPKNCVVLEDAPQGIAAARSAGMAAIGVASTRPPEMLLEADLVVPSVGDPRVRAFLLGERSGRGA